MVIKDMNHFNGSGAFHKLPRSEGLVWKWTIWQPCRKVASVKKSCFELDVGKAAKKFRSVSVLKKKLVDCRRHSQIKNPKNRFWHEWHPEWPDWANFRPMGDCLLSSNNQGDQIGRNFAYRAKVYFGRVFLKMSAVAQFLCKFLLQ
jgi:hypothetical protein